jgi:hypothetical protein
MSLRIPTPAALLLVLVGCLPEAAPGPGARILPGRGMVEVAFGPLGAPPPLIFTRETTTIVSSSGQWPTSPRDLLAITAAGREPQPVAVELEPFGSFQRWDARGRLIVEGEERLEADERLSTELTRFDPVTGGIERLGRVRRVVLSADGDWLTYDGVAGGTTVLGPGAATQEQHLGAATEERQSGAATEERQSGAATEERQSGAGRWELSPSVSQVGTVGGALIFVQDDRLLRLRPGADLDRPEVLAGGVLSWLPGPGGVLVLTGAAGAPADLEQIDVTASPPVVRPVAAGLSPTEQLTSNDGEQVAMVEQAPGGSVRIRVLSVGDGAQRTVEIAVAAPPPGTVSGGASSVPQGPSGLPIPSAVTTVAFRPGHPGELWCFVGGRLFVLPPQGGARPIEGPLEASVRFRRPRREPPGAPIDSVIQSDGSSMFSSDGRRWLFRAGRGEVRLGDADHPGEDPGMLLTSELLGERPEVIELAPGGPLAVEDEPPGGERRDLYLAEPPWESRRLLVRDISRVIWGSGRALALARKIGRDGVGGDAGSGDLSLVDLATGAETVLARNVVDMALARPCAGCDPLAPGVPLAYVVQARVPFRLDGLWLAALP